MIIHKRSCKDCSLHREWTSWKVKHSFTMPGWSTWSSIMRSIFTNFTLLSRIMCCLLIIFNAYTSPVSFLFAFTTCPIRVFTYYGDNKYKRIKRPNSVQVAHECEQRLGGHGETCNSTSSRILCNTENVHYILTSDTLQQANQCNFNMHRNR